MYSSNLAAVNPPEFRRQRTAIDATTHRPDGRRQRSSRTRARIVDAAMHRFVAGGYVPTTMEAVAEQAGVAVQTVYYAFGTKRNLLAAVLDASIAGDATPAPVVEQPWVHALASAPDARAAVSDLVAAAVAIVARTTPVYEVIHRAAADPEVAALLTATRQGRRADQRRLVEILDRAGHLVVDVDAAADVVYALLNEEVFQLLTTDCGWDIDRFRAWATFILLTQLTAPDGF